MVKILINLAERRLYFYKNEQKINSYPVAIGKPNTPTPPGTYTVVNKIVNPHLSVLGTRWMGLSKPGYGIHGTNNPASIGTMASLGCIRMYNRDVEEIFPEVPIGTSVEIISGGGSYNPKPQTPSQKTSGQRYIVQRGDTLWRLSQRFGVSLDALIKANNLSNPNVLHVGQELIIPG
ncbi:MAG: L,D-transpeptidase family protein [Clostridia bacterium]|jgi:LysM repeat protein|nr:L,D-transpeptidase family protein [Clostridia bacterium]